MPSQHCIALHRDSLHIHSFAFWCTMFQYTHATIVSSTWCTGAPLSINYNNNSLHSKETCASLFFLALVSSSFPPRICALYGELFSFQSRAARMKHFYPKFFSFKLNKVYFRGLKPTIIVKQAPHMHFAVKNENERIRVCTFVKIWWWWFPFWPPLFSRLVLCIVNVQLLLDTIAEINFHEKCQQPKAGRARGTSVKRAHKRRKLFNNFEFFVGAVRELCHNGF